MPSFRRTNAAIGAFRPLDTAMRYRNAVTKTGRTEALTCKQIFRNGRTGDAAIVFKQQPCSNALFLLEISRSSRTFPGGRIFAIFVMMQ
jgi:hypothetical protein